VAQLASGKKFNMIRIVSSILLSLASILLSAQPPKAFKVRYERIAKLSEAIVKKDISGLKPYLDEKFSYENKTGAAAVDELEAFLQNQHDIIGAISCSVMSTKPGEDLYENEIALSVADSFRYGLAIFTREGNFTCLDFLHHQWKAPEYILANDSGLLYHEIPLYFPGHIFIKGSAEGKDGFFWLDTGSPGITKGPNGASVSEVILNNRTFSFPFSGKIKENTLDMYPGFSWLAILGENLFASYTTTIDYIHKKFILTPLNSPIDTTQMDGYDTFLVDILYGNQGHIFFRNCRIGNLFGLIQYDTGGWDDEFQFNSELAKEAGFNTEPSVADINVDGFLIKQAWWDSTQFRDERPLHGNNVISALYNGAFSNCILTIYPNAKKILIRKSKEVERGMNLGINLIWSKAFITSILPGSTAEKMGLQIGDEIIEFNHKTYNRPADLREALRNRVPMEPFSINFMRKEKVLTLNYPY
jgi:hypothetical protein